ncbi:MAG: zinc-dependent alcohol dehydrogenase [Ruminococcus sp.]|jgi:2-desacetyl-2-hydroxyethyl bacteriochlorophyllide A dehydrogenase
MMKAAIYLGKEQVEVRELPMPVCGDDDVLIQNIYSSICGTDVAVYNHGPNTGHRITVGGEFGHETVSRVAAVGKNVSEFRPGERVYPYPLFAKNDTKRAGTIGGFSEYILIPKAKKNHSLYVVQDEISDKLASLTEPFTVGCRAARRSQPKESDQAVVFGSGTIGLAAAAALQYFGAGKVLVCDLSDYRLNIAAELGFEVCNIGKEDIREKGLECFGAARSLSGETWNADIFLDAAGDESVFETFMRQGKIGSRFVAVAVNNKLRQLDMLHLTYAQKSVVGSGGYLPEDVRDVMKMMASGRWDLEKIITHEFPLDEINEAIRTASDTEHALNVLIHMADVR